MVTGAPPAPGPAERTNTDGNMPLKRARDSYTVYADGIRFLMRDGSYEVICQIRLEALSQIGNTADLCDTIGIFQRERAMIERAASAKYDGTSRLDYEIVIITPADLAPGVIGAGSPDRASSAGALPAAPGI
jgi:hypothetical protein